MLQAASELTPRPIDWLWTGYLAVGSLAMLDGDPGLGKSLLTLDLAARLTTGRPWPNGEPSPGPAPVILLCNEDPDDVILARLKALGADLPRVHLWPRLDEPGPPRIPSEAVRLENDLARTGARLLVIDPIVAFLDANVQVSSDANIRRALRPLAKLAEKYRCVALMVRHLKKQESSNALYRGGGSIGFVAACRLAWLVGRDPRIHERLVLAQAKNNYAPPQPSLAYRLPKETLLLDWQGSSCWSADELSSRRARPSRRRARDFLRLILESGPRTARDIWTASRELGFTASTLRRAREDLEIRTERLVQEGQRYDYWLLPGQHPPGAASDTPDLDDWLRRWRALYPPRTPLENAEELLAL